MLGTGFGDPADDAIVLDQLPDHPSGKHPFRAMRHMYVERFRVPRRREAKIGAQTG